MTDKQTQLPDDRARMVRELRMAKLLAPLETDSPFFQTLLEDCAGELSDQWALPDDDLLETALAMHDCVGIISNVDLLGRWLKRHPLFPVINRMTVAYTPSPRVVQNELRTLLRELEEQLAKAITVADQNAKSMTPVERTAAEATMNDAHEVILMVRDCDVDDVMSLRELAVMTAVGPFERDHDMMPAEEKFLN